MTMNDNQMTIFSRAKISLGKDKDIHFNLYLFQTLPVGAANQFMNLSEKMLLVS